MSDAAARIGEKSQYSVFRIGTERAVSVAEFQ